MGLGMVPCEAGSQFLPVDFSRGTPPFLRQKEGGWKAQLLQVAQLGHPILRQKCQEVPKVISGQGIQLLIDDMIATCLDIDGVGIAAPQVYSPIRLFIVASRPNARYPNAPEMEPTAIINPVIHAASNETEKDWEGCLSIPGIRGLILRSKSIDVSYFNRHGDKETKTFEGFVARVFQHEFDHIEGTVFTDRVDRKEIVTEKEYQRILREKQKA